ncbi:MAG: glycosyltransferase family 4 protein [Opitutae bacterium]|nr:glycosyltransferase family 4 protein [Opitutae bacterium]
MGAAANRIYNLASGLSERDNEVTVICPLPNYPEGRVFQDYRGKLYAKESEGALSVYRYWIYPSVSSNPLLRVLSMLSFAVSLWGYVLRAKAISKVDYVIIQNSPLLVSMSGIVLFKKIFRKKIALNVSDLWPLSALELGAIKKGRMYHILEWIERFNYRNADCVLGQSNEIIDHVQEIEKTPSFLYRNLQPQSGASNSGGIVDRVGSVRLVYAGLLGVAQGMLDMVKAINFSELSAELEIYGHGNEEEAIRRFIDENPECGVSYKGSLKKEELHARLPEYDASIVPLKTRIKGAVPSKIFELIYLQVPVLFCGGGEGARIVDEFNVGFSSEPGDFESLKLNIRKLGEMSASDLQALKQNCINAAQNSLDFDKQLDELVAWLKK